MARIELTTHLKAAPFEVWEHVQRPALLHYVAHGLIRFVPRGKRWPERWSPGEYRAWMFLFGFVPIGWQSIRIEMPPSDGPIYRVRDNGFGPLIRRWDHMIEIAPERGGTRYCDRVEVEAGALTPLIASFARLFYAHRQRRWVRLVENGFNYSR